MWISLLISMLSSETVKLLARRATKALVERTNTNIDNELANALLMDIAKSDGNAISKEVVTTIIEGAINA